MDVLVITKSEENLHHFNFPVSPRYDNKVVLAAVVGVIRIIIIVIKVKTVIKI